MVLSGFPMFATCCLLFPGSVVGQEGLLSSAEDDDCPIVALFQAEVAHHNVGSRQVERSKVGCDDPRQFEHSPCCSGLCSDDVAGKLTDDAFRQDFIAGHALLDVPVEPQSKHAPSEAVALLLRSFVSLMTFAVAADAAWRWHRQRCDTDSCHAAELRSKRDVVRPRRQFRRPPLGLQGGLREPCKAAVQGWAACCNALLDTDVARDALEAPVLRNRKAKQVATLSFAEPVPKPLSEWQAQIDAVGFEDESLPHIAAHEGHADVRSVSRGRVLVSELITK